MESVTDREILNAYRFLYQEEGIFVEPASAASVAGVMKLAKRGTFHRGGIIACILTGHGLKDPERAIQVIEKPVTIEPTLDALKKSLNL